MRRPAARQTIQGLQARSEAGVTRNLTFGSFPQNLVRRGDGSSLGSLDIYDPHFVPKGGWDKWCTWALHQGKIGRIQRSKASNAMAITISHDVEDIEQDIQDLLRKVHLTNRTVEANLHWRGYGRTFIEPIYEVPDGTETEDLPRDQLSDLVEIKVLQPPSMTILFDTADTVTELQKFLTEKGSPRMQQYATSLQAGTGDEIIGYAQNWPLRDAKRTVVWRPDELICIRRYPDSTHPEGWSELAENYVVIMNKLGMERDQAIMGRRFVDPKVVYTIPKTAWAQKDKIMQEIRVGLQAGLDLHKPEGFEIDILEPKGNAAAVIRYQEHLEDQLIAGLGFADSFTESTASNRSVGEIQLQFFERDLEPERALFAEIFEDELLAPLVRARHGPKAAAPRIEYLDITPENVTEKAKAMAPWAPYMSKGQREKFLEDMGYPLPEGEELPDGPVPGAGMPGGLAGVQQPGAAGGAPPADDPTSQAFRALLEVATTLQISPQQAIEALVVHRLTTDYGQAGVPKPVLIAGARAREHILTAFDRWYAGVADDLEAPALP